MVMTEEEIEYAFNQAEHKAWDGLAGGKFQAFGHWAALWVFLDGIGETKRPNPFSDAVKLAKHVIEETNVADTYPRPDGGWVCFHCGEHFMRVPLARVHFGDRPSQPVGCSVDLEEYRRMRRSLHAANMKLARHGLSTPEQDGDAALVAE